MKVLDMMTRELARLPPSATVKQAIELLTSRKVSSVVVEKEAEEEPWGIVTRSDIVLKVAAPGRDPVRVSLGEIMSPALVTIDPGLDVGYASLLMRRFGIRHLLRSVPFFEKLHIDDLIALLTVSSVRECAQGETFITEGDHDRDLFLLEQGEMSVSTRRAGRIARIRAGELFGEVELFGGPRSATIRAVVASRVIVIDGKRFIDLAVNHQRLGAVVFESMTRLLSDRLRRANRFLFLRGIWTHRLLVLRSILIAAGIFVILVLGTATVSETPSLCPTCHYMRPYHASWESSAHRDISCAKCHWTYGLRGALRGKITGLAMVVRHATQTYDPKPEAKVEDASCERSDCHDPDSRIRRYRTSAGDFRFDHDRHLERLTDFGELRCTSCHSHRGQEEHFSVSASTCFLCHFPGAKTPPTPCKGCHDFSPPADGTIIPARVDHSSFENNADCLACHRNYADGSSIVEEFRCSSCHLRPDSLSTVEMHRIHVQVEDVDCFECHTAIEHPGTSSRIIAGRCEACHGEKHVAQERLYLGEGGVGVAGRPALMSYYHVECTACHQAEAAGSDSAQIPAHADSTRDPCLKCHEVTVEDQARMWKRTVEQSLERVRSALTSFERQAGGRSVHNREAFGIYEEARQNYEIVASDPSAAIHNFRYAQDLLKISEERLREAINLLGDKKETSNESP
jgi:CRP-like cAMP-binding protein